jgi:uncharacterized protein
MADEVNPRFAGHFPGRASFDAYGNGGFRFGGMSHKGSLLALPSGVWAWDVRAPEEISHVTLKRAFDELAAPHFLLLGTGRRQVFPPLKLRNAFLDAKIGLDVMDTGAACRTYNVLLAEGRPVSAAIIAVE